MSWYRTIWKCTCIASLHVIAIEPTSAQTPVVHFQFEGDGTDSAGGDHGGILNGGATTSAPNLGPGTGQSILLDGVDDYVSITNGTTIIPGSSKFTLATYINLAAFPSGTNTSEVIYFSNPSGGAAARLVFQIRGNGSGGASFSVGGRTQQANGFSRYLASVADVLGAGNTSLSLDTTYHIAATIDTTLAPADAVQLYLNGLPVADTLQAGAGFTQAPFDNTIGFSATVGATGVPNTFLNGRMDDVRIYNEVLTAGQIRSLVVPEPTAAALAISSLVAWLSVRRRK